MSHELLCGDGVVELFSKFVIASLQLISVCDHTSALLRKKVSEAYTAISFVNLPCLVAQTECLHEFC